MKKTILLGVFNLFLFVNCQGQWIQQLKTNPSILTTNTPVELIADIDFPSGGCNDKTLNLIQSGNVFSGDALHCLGVASVICNDKDTFSLGLLPAGTYSFFFRADIGMGPSPCTPGIVAGPVDSLTFVVNLASGNQELEKGVFELFPNPTSSILQLKIINDLVGGSYRIINIQGALVLKSNIIERNTQIDISQLSDGLYTFIYENALKNISIKKFAKK